MLIEEFLDKGNLHNDIKRNVSYIRTILDTFIEKSLTIEYSTKFRDNYEIVNYKNRALFFYKCKKSYENFEMLANFILGQLETKFIDTSCAFIESTNIENTKKLSNYVLDQITDLRNVKEIYLDNKDKAIIKAYKLFYLENPDFSRKDINLRIQTMVLILNQFNLFTEYKFNIQNDMIESCKLTDMVNRLFPLGEVTVVKDSIEFKGRLIKIIRLVGETIRERIGNEEKLNEVLLTISKTIYAEEFDITPLSEAKELVEYSNLGLTYNEVEDSIRLVNTIQSKINSIK